jgi:hypothetical protein
MNRLLVFALMISLGNASVAVAGETLLQAATRAAEELVAAEASSAQAAHARAAVPGLNKTTPERQRVNFQQAPPGLQSSGLGRGSKLLIGLGIAASFVGIAMAIDSRVEDNTPSTKGERINEPY